MNVLVIGRGGREHAIVWALRKSPKVGRIYCAPGNAGIAQMAECVPIGEKAFDELGRFAREREIGLVVVGPEDPLLAGAVDYFSSIGIPAFGPTKAAAEIEGSKSFAKGLMAKYGIPTAAYASFDDHGEALAYLRGRKAPVVVKADGLAAGKGVTVARTMEEAEAALKAAMLDRVFGDAGSRVVIEEFLEGQEMSVLSFVDGETVLPMVPAQDHKPVFDGDQGPNTGGMGTYSPVPHIPDAVVEKAVDTIIRPAARAMVKEGRPFRGVLFTGLMITPEGEPKVIEFNCRFGDPETQVVLPRLKTDLLDIMLATVEGRLADVRPEWSEEAAVCVVLASGGYPGPYKKGLPIRGLDRVEQSIVFHAGTVFSADGAMVTDGGRLLGVTATGRDLAEARAKAYADVEKIEYEGKHYRTDIGLKALKALDA